VLEEIDYIYISRVRSPVEWGSLVAVISSGTSNSVQMITSDVETYFAGKLNAMQLDGESSSGEDEARA
jgi:hypothetical protein